MPRQDEDSRTQAVREHLLRAGVEESTLDEQLAEGDQVYADALYLLTRMRFEPGESRVFWDEILHHLDGLSESLGRDVGLRVAVCDYFVNLHPRMREPVIVEVQVLLQQERGALVDDLTGLFNRRYFNDAIVREVERYKRFGQRFSLIMLDVDHFKRFNDTYGHLAGDDALRTVASALREAARGFDHVVRYGGEEFALILPHTDAEQAHAAAERLRCAVEEMPMLVGERPTPLTVSLGTATFPEDAFTARELLARADEALYEAKRMRNAVCSFDAKNRKHPRMPLGMTVLCNGPDLEPVAVRMQDISFGGMLCRSPVVIFPGSHVEIILTGDAAAEQSMRLNCRVARLEKGAEVGQFEVGLSFVLISDEERRDLVRLVDQGQGAGI